MLTNIILNVDKQQVAFFEIMNFRIIFAV